ncbi:MAG: HAMP domain-containing histidine kinase, partial [Paracoccaceae bacterium]|nr:HAMP domain-containing histidine kinase [Paracoccaceae bacterium]
MRWPHALLRSTPVRLAIFLVALFTLVSLASFGGTYLVIRNSLYAGMRADLEQQMAGFAAAPSAAALSAIIANQGAVTDPTQRVLTYLAPDGQVYGNTALMRGPEGFLQLDLGPNAHNGPHNYLGLAGDFFGGQLIIAENRQPVIALGNMFLDVLILSLLPTFAIALGGGLWLAHRSKLRVERITDTLQRLTSGDLSARVDNKPGDNDLSLIGTHIDRMAARQQSATEALRQVSADIAHDLKTPIQRVSLLLNQLEAQPDLAPASATLATRAREDADGIVATFQSLLQIAQIEGGSPKARFAPVDLADLTRT